jgi:HAD superfamily hydrolase (TIGR01509 family)
MVRAVLFDFDGVVVQSEPLHKRTFLELLAPYGVTVPERRWYREFAGTGSRHIFEVLVREHNLGLDVDRLVAERKAVYEARVRAGDLKITPGAREFVMMLKSRGIRAAVVSGSHRTNIQAAFEALGLNGLFDIVISGDDIPERKPHPGPFLRAAKMLGVPPSGCLVIEDSYSGCESAKKAGMLLAWLKPGADMAPPAAYDIEISDFTGDSLRKLESALSG